MDSTTIHSKEPNRALHRWFSPDYPYHFINTVFVLSRLLFYASGARFDISRMETLHQLLDPVLLQTDLLRSLFYQHNQPPLLNFLLGLCLKTFPNHVALVFGLVFLVLGLAMINSLLYLLLRYGVSARLSAGCVVLFTISPACLLYENWLFYTHLNAALLVYSVFFLFRYVETSHRGYGFAFFLTLAAIAILRSVFHLVWFGAAVALLLGYHRRKWREILALALIPFVLIVALYAKNSMIFGFFGSSSSFGMHFSKVAIQLLPEAQRNALLRDGKVSPLAAIQPFLDFSTYKPFFGPLHKTNIPVLDAPCKASGAPNMNHLAYVTLAKKYQQDSMAAVKAYPGHYAKNVCLNVYQYMMPTDYYYFIHVNRICIYPYARLFDQVIYGHILENFDLNLLNLNFKRFFPSFLLHAGLFILAAYALLLGFFAWRWKAYLPTGTARNAINAAIAFMIMNHLYVTILVNLVECNENNRYRYLIEPLTFVLMGICLHHLLPRIRPWFHKKLW